MAKSKNDFDELEAFIQEVRKSVIIGSEKTVKQMADLVFRRVRKNVNLRDHTLAELRALGHPHGKGTSKSGKKREAIPHDPEYLVHRREGNIYDNIEKFETSNKNVIEVGILADVSFAEDILFGENRQVSRDFLQGSLAEVRKNLKKMARKNMKKSVKNIKRKKKNKG